MKKMTSRERMMTALRYGMPDRVPVAPDFSCMIPCRLTGKPFWEVLLHNDPPLLTAYLNAVRYYGTDGWCIYGALDYKQKSAYTVEQQIVSTTGERMTVKLTYRTPDGDLDETYIYPVADAPTPVEKMIKDFKTDFPKIKHLFSDITSYSRDTLDRQRAEVGEQGMLGVGIATPGLQIFLVYFHGSLEAATYAMMDEPELFEELCHLYDRYVMQQTEIAIACGADSILTGGSGSITMQSPELWRKMSLPTIRKQTALCREAGIISGIHSCGKEKYMVEVCANETDLNYINPLEIPPMGDCDLAECKKLTKGKLALMGNLHTTEIMLRGTPQDVRREALKAILAAGRDGGFVLSTGDQCGRDTPDANIFELVKTVNEFGWYPLNVDRIQSEIEKLSKK